MIVLLKINGITAMNKKSAQFKLLALSTLIASSMAISACGAKDDAETSAKNSKEEAVQTTEPMLDTEKPEVMQAEEVPTDEQIAAEQQAEQAALAESDKATEGDTPEQAGNEVTQAEAEAAAEALAAADEVQ